MECQEIKYKLQELVDGSLNNEEAIAIRKHLKSCHGCTKDYRLLALAAEAVKTLPLSNPSPMFNAKIMESLGLDYRPTKGSSAIKWVAALLLGLSSFWIAALGLGFYWGLNRADPRMVYSWTKSTLALLSDFQSVAVRAALRLAEIVGLVSKVFSAMVSGSNFPAQAAISAVIALGLMVLLSQRIRQKSNI